MRNRANRWLVEVADGVAPFEAEWRALVRGDNATPFQDFEVMRQFYRQVAEAGGGAAVVALVRHADGRPAALFPMLRGRKHGLNWLRTDARPLDYCCPVVDPAIEAKDVVSLFEAVLKAVPRVDVLYCNRVTERFAGRLNPVVGLPNAAPLRLSSWELPLGGRDEAALLAAQQSRSRSSLRSRTKKLAEAHDRRFEIRIGSEISAADFEAFRVLRAQSFEDKGRADILSDSDWSSFYDGLVAGRGAVQGWLATLSADGELIAALFGLCDSARIEAMLPASKLGEWQAYAPGLQLFQETILHFHKSGAQLYDLSIGDMVYKQRFGCERVGLYDALFPKGLLGRLYYIGWRLKVQIRSKMRSIAADA